MRGRRTRDEDLVQIAVNHAFDDRAVRPALFRQRDEQGTGARSDDGVGPPARDRRLVGATAHRALRREHRDTTGTRRPARGRSARLEHADDRHRVEFVRERIECDGRRGVACDDETFHAALVQQARRLQGILADRCGTLGAVRQPRGVAEIDEVFAGQPVEQCAQHGQPADAGVEHADRRGVRNRLVALQFAAHWGPYLPTVRSIADAAIDITPRHAPGPLPS